MKPRLLDLFCGAGGAAMGYYRAGFEVVGVDSVAQPRYPFEFHQADAMAYPLGGFDAIHASPPCQAYVDFNKNRESSHPRLIEPTVDRLSQKGVPFVVENVIGPPLQANLMLCGTMFDLLVIRHRFFNCGFSAPLSPFSCTHIGTVASGDYAAVYGFGAHGHRDANGVRGKAAEGPDWEKAMGIDWMTKAELREAIPPAYTEFIGAALLRHLEVPDA